MPKLQTPRRIARLTLATASAAAIALSLSITTVLAWAPPSLSSLCAPDANHLAWRITLSQEPDYLIQLSWSADFASNWTVNFESAGSHAFETDRAGSTLHARWKNDKAKKASAAANNDLCVQGTPTPTPTPTATSTPTPTLTPTPTPTPSDDEEASTPSPTPRGTVAGGNPTPAPILPNTATDLSQTASVAFALPVALLVLMLATVARAHARRR